MASTEVSTSALRRNIIVHQTAVFFYCDTIILLAVHSLNIHKYINKLSKFWLYDIVSCSTVQVQKSRMLW